jgi:hypothetical protein
MRATQNQVIFNEIIFENDIETLQQWINELRNLAEQTGDKTTFNVALKFHKQYIMMQQMYAGLKNSYENHLQEVNTWNIDQWANHELLKKELETSKDMNYRLYCKYTHEKTKTTNK